MKCVRCGEELKADVVFCEKCGTKVQRVGDSEAKTEVLKHDRSSDKVPNAAGGNETNQDPKKPDTSGVDVSAYPTAVQPPVGEPVFSQTTPMPPVSEQKQYVAASSAESVSPPQTKKSKLPIIIAIVASAVALVAVTVLIVTFVLGEEDESSKETAQNYAVQKEQELASNSATSQQKESATQPSSSSSIDDVINSPDGFILPESDTRYYSDSELNALTDYQLYLARNEIYARYGREFKNQDLHDYFWNKYWYSPRYSADSFDSIVTLNVYEKKNADTILAIEKRRRSSYLG